MNILSVRNLIKRILIIPWVLFIPLNISAQNPKTIDSLFTVLQNNKDQKVQCNTLNQLAIEYQRSDVKKSENYNKQSMQLALKIKDKDQIASSYFTQGSIYKLHGDFNNAMESMIKSKNLYTELKDTLRIANTTYAIGVIYNLLNDQKNAMFNLIEAMTLFEKIHETRNLSKSYNALGVIYLSQKQYKNALEYFEKSLKIDTEKGFKLGMSASLLNIGNVYYQADRNYKKAILYFEDALKIKEELKDAQGTQKCLNNIGAAYMSLGQVSKSIEYHQRALQSALEINEKNAVATCYINLGYDYQKAEKLPQAIIYAKTGYDMALELENIDLLNEASRVLYESYAAQNNYNQAFEYLIKNKSYNDTLEKNNNFKAVNEIKSRYDVVKKDNEIKALSINKKEQELKLVRLKIRNYLFIGLIFCGLIAVVFMYYRSRSSRKINNKLQEINDLKSHFFANLSHEFRTPITLMLGPVEKLLEDARPEDEPWLKLIHKNASRLLFLDEQLLEFTRIDSGNQKINLLYGNIITPVKATVSSYEIIAQKKNIKYTTNILKDTIETYFDLDILEKIISNLLNNAFKYTQPGGNVSFKLSVYTFPLHQAEVSVIPLKSGDYIRIDVEDNGLGIPDDKKEKIFERFYQLNNNPGGNFEGAGIGLALTRELLKLHHGWIELKSEVGKGSCFSIYLPLTKENYTSEELKHAKPLQKSDAVYSSINNISDNTELIIPTDDSTEIQSRELLPHILIVDDNSDMRIYIKEILKPFYKITEASNGLEGYSAALNNLPDLVITDLMMHTMDGIELCRMLKSDEKTNPVPVIMLTTLTDQADKLQEYETGADDYITKPFNSQELVIRTKNLIAQREKLKNLFIHEFKIQPKAVSIPSSDAKLIQNLISFIENNIDKPELDVNLIVKELAISRTQLHRKITSLTNQSITGFIKVIRMKRAAFLIEQKTGNITEVMYAVGFDNLSYFSKCFREVYAMTPREYQLKCMSSDKENFTSDTV